MTWRARSVLTLGAAAVVAGCGTRAGAPDPATSQGKDTVRLWLTMVIIAVVIAAIVLGLIFYAAIRWRARGDTSELPPQRHANVPLEVLYTLTPLVIVLGLFGYSAILTYHADHPSRPPDVTVDVVGFRWGWRFHYEGTPVTTVGVAPDRPLLVLPVDRDVRFNLRSDDVIHSLYVPGFLTKRDLIPGTDNHFQVHTTRTGRFRGYCAEFCGLDHARMLFDVRIVTPADYSRWLAQRSTSSSGAGSGPGPGSGSRAP